MPSALSGLSEGLWASIDEQRKENIARDEQRSQLERTVLSTLLESDDPQVRSMAIAGMLDAAAPKRRMKGMKGFLDEYERNPQIGKIQQYLSTPQQVQVRPRLASKGLPAKVGGGPAPLPSPGSAALPATSPVTGGPSATPAMVGQPPPAITGQSPFTEAHSGERGAVMESRLPQAFLPPEERMRLNTIAREKAEIDARVEAMRGIGMPEEQIQQAIRGYIGGRYGMGATARGYQRVAVEDQSGVQSMAVFDPMSGRYLDPDTGQPLENVRPLTRTGSGNLGVDREALSRAMFGGRAYAALKPEEQQAVLDAELERKQTVAGATTTGRSEAAAVAPLSSQQRFEGTTKLQKEWLDVSKSARTTREAYSRIKTGMDLINQGKIQAGSEVLLVSFQKMLDSISVVRESEYLRPQVGLTLLDRAQGMFERYIQTGGSGVPVEVLKQYAEAADQLSGKIEAALEPERARIQKTAESFGIDPTLVVPGGAPPSGGGPAGVVATPPPAGPGAAAAPVAPAAPSAPKVTDMARIRAYAQRTGRPEAEIIAEQEARGYTITDKP